ncbi:MAG: YkgJ family cysteine cluster protein [Bdellovibrionales bacterium]|nr:YkgJ family cysteine cluster protein [Bdellovibrionales bacterium]
MLSESQKKFFSEGLRFQCQGTGKCCISRGEYGYVYMTREDRKNMAAELKMSLVAFTKKYCKQSGGYWHLKSNPDGPECLFLNKKNQCDVYKARPVQCRTWPFWPENMNAKTWRDDIAKNCAGIGKGPLRSAKEVEAQLTEQLLSEIE